MLSSRGVWGRGKRERKRKQQDVGKARLLKGNVGNVHRSCSKWLQLRIYPIRPPQSRLVQMPEYLYSSIFIYYEKVRDQKGV